MSERERRRFWSKVVMGSRDECWAWLGQITEKGYASFSVERKPYPAHRYAFEVMIGPIPDGLTLDHLCRNRGCVNPFHVEPVTNRVNVLRGIGPSAVNAIKETCARGHDNWRTSRRADGRTYRFCRTCKSNDTLRLYRADPEKQRARFRDYYARTVAAQPVEVGHD